MPLIVLCVIHHPEHVKFASRIEYAPDQSKAAVADVEDDAVADLVGRSEGLLECPEVGPLGGFGQLEPSEQIFLGEFGIVFPGFSEPPRV